MNGLISVSAPRNTAQAKTATSVTVGLCLFTGFLVGMNVSTLSLAHLNPFRTETLDYNKISWISEQNIESFKLGEGEAVSVASDVSFTPYDMKIEKEKRFFFRSFQKPASSNLLKLQRIVKLLQRPKVDLHQDYRNASYKFNRDFQSVIAGEVPAREQMIAMTSSSASLDADSGTKRRNRDNSFVASLGEAPVRKPFVHFPVRHSQKLIPSPRSVEVSSNEVAPNPTPSRKVSMVARATVKTGVSRVDTQTSAVMKIPSPLLKAIPQAAPAEIPADSSIAARQVEVNSMASLTQNAPVEMGGAAFATGSEDLTGATTAELPIVTSAPISNELSSADQKKLANDLLNFQFIAQNAKREALLASNVAVAPSRNPIPLPDTRENSIPDEQNADEPISENGSRKNQINGKTAGNTAECNILPNHEFIRPINSGTGETNNQICPTHKKWISKNKNNSGWVKVEGSNHLATLTLTPAPSQGSTLLIDENGLALLALKSGIHITKGMGIIIGTAPEGYKVEFTGRAEETEYFETNGHSYFAILNVEPGAGVVELESKTNQNLNSTVFTPILEDTVTYLDLVSPVLQDLPIKVVKSGKENDPEVMNLTVGISTQSGIQAITQADGKAILKNANLVPGYPVFIDVSSRSGVNQSYTYRYQLKQRKKSGFFVVNEISEKSISGWLAQVKQGLSDQGAMVVGFYDRKTLDGFKNHYFTKVEPLTSKFGLEPLNYSLLWDGSISNTEPLEGDAPRFMSVQVAEGLSQVQLLDETQKPVQMELLPISPRVIHVISE